MDIFSECYQKHDTDTIEDLLNEELLENLMQCKNKNAKFLIEADIEEVKQCFAAGAYKATLIMAGSVLEAFLIDWLSQIHRKDYFKVNYQVVKLNKDGTPKLKKNGEKEKRDANLCDYINEIKTINPPVWMDEKYAEEAHKIREKRNLVHAKLCLKEDANIDKQLCMEVIGYLGEIVQTRYCK